MPASGVMETISRVRIVPVVVMEDPASAIPLADALLAGGLPIMEVTFRTAAAAAAIERIAASRADMLLGAGTVITIDQVKTAVRCGAMFIVSPGFSRPVAEYCMQEQIPVFPGVITPTEIMAAAAMGLDTLKFFPAESAGGVKYLSSVSAPFRNIRFIPTGGIDERNLQAYLAHPLVVACGGSWMVKPEFLKDRRFDDITRFTQEAVRLVCP
jgi:2-dehydro-3-deoxyphosphogluconate aldolase / (4S)-4-hydroxy-2-oxoglutarate aldolase